MISIRHLGKNTNSTQYPQKIEEDATLPNSFYEAHHPDIKAKETALKEKKRRKPRKNNIPHEDFSKTSLQNISINSTY